MIAAFILSSPSEYFLIITEQHWVWQESMCWQ